MSKNIYQKINEIRKQVHKVGKDATVGYGNNQYRAVTHDKVLSLIRPLMIDQGIMIIPCQQDKGVSVPGKTKNGADKIRFEAVYDVKFINADNPEDCFVVPIEAHGEDSNDKGPGKAVSYATKSAMLKVFSLETGDNDEVRLADRYNKDEVIDCIRTMETFDDLKDFWRTNAKGMKQEMSPNDYADVEREKDGKKAEFESAN